MDMQYNDNYFGRCLAGCWRGSCQGTLEEADLVANGL